MIDPIYQVTDSAKWRRFANNFIIMFMSIFLIILITKTQYNIVPRPVLFWRIVIPVSSFIWEMLRYNKHFTKILAIYKRKKLIKKQVKYKNDLKQYQAELANPEYDYCKKENINLVKITKAQLANLDQLKQKNQEKDNTYRIISEVMPNGIEVIYLAGQFINAVLDILCACLLIS